MWNVKCTYCGQEKLFISYPSKPDALDRNGWGEDDSGEYHEDCYNEFTQDEREYWFTEYVKGGMREQIYAD